MPPQLKINTSIEVYGRIDTRDKLTFKFWQLIYLQLDKSKHLTVILTEYVTVEKNMPWHREIARKFARINDTICSREMTRSGTKKLCCWIKSNILSQLTFYVSTLKSNILSQLYFYDEDPLSLPRNARAGILDINWFLNFSNWYLGNCFVKISATFSLVDICSI